MTHYTTLNVDENASDDDIKKAYRKLSFQYHPDRNKSNESVEIFQKINEANEVLSDPLKRRQYDMERQFDAGFGPFFQGMGSMGVSGVPIQVFHMDDMNSNNMSDLFSLFTGLEHPPSFFQNKIPTKTSESFPQKIMKDFINVMHKMPSIETTLDLTLDQAFNGCTVPFSYERWIIEDGMKKHKEETINLTIPPGIDDGEVVTLSGQGNMISKNQKSDVKIEIHIDDHSHFIKQGNDLLLLKTLSLKEALTGFSFIIDHLNGRQISFNNVENIVIIKPGDKKIIKELGMVRENVKGNLIIQFEIQFPKQLENDTIEQLRTLL